jgi:cytochrome bd-type quinol oxidase subunit 1
MERKNKVTVGLLFLSIAYMFSCCLIFFSFALITVKLVISHEVNIKQSDIEHVLVASAIAGIAAAFRSWLFAKIDERKTRKPPPSDPH